jgi:pimeloyl-ACP methyl ester carboxylesterase
MRTRHTIALVMSVLASACTTGGASNEPPVSDSATTSLVEVEEPVTPLSWGPCSGSDAECTVVQVPFDHDDPDLGTFDLLVARHRARQPNERIGVLFTNAGGPGAESIWLAQDANWYFPEEITDRFDIVAWDPRGTSGSRPQLDCTDDIDPYFSLAPRLESRADRTTIVDAARDFVDSCVENVDHLLPYIGTEAAARDIDLVRRLLGEETVSYLGFSYGSELGAVWATSFPDTVRAAVFDAAADPNLDLADWSSFQAEGFEKALDTFLDDCDTDGCEFVSDDDSRTVFDRIMSDIETTPLEVDTDRPPVTASVARIAVLTALYSRSSWSTLDMALAEASLGHGDRLLTLYDEYFGGWRDGHPDDSIDSYLAITCLDRERDLSVPEAFDTVDRLTISAPNFAAVMLHELLVCALWPVDPSPPPDVRWAGEVPILVLGSTGDPATPLEGTRRMYETLGNARLIVVDSFDHTSYGTNECATEAVDRYLVDLVVPAGELAC